MSLTLLPQEVLLLCAAWNRAGHLPERANLSTSDLRKHYADRLAAQIADWLFDGLMSWQVPLQRKYAFAPVPWLIGTMRQHESYLDALAELGDALMHHDDPLFLSMEDDLDDALDPVSLGVVYADAAALAVCRLAHVVAHAPPVRAVQLQALLDALGLVQRLTPGKVAGPLQRAWNLLFGATPVDVLDVVPHSELALHQAFVRALYPVMHPGQDREILNLILTRFLQAIRAAARTEPAYAELEEDLEPCYAMIHCSPPASLPPAHPVRPLAAGMPARWENALRPRERNRITEVP